MNRPKTGLVRRRYWIGILTLVMAALLMISYVPTWAAPSAAPHNQTVPDPTPRPDPTSVPTATPHNDDDDDDDDEDRDEGSDDSDNGDSNAPDESLPDPEGTPEPEALEEGDVLDAGNPGAFALDNLPGGEVVVVRLNVRSGPGTDFDIVGTMNSGERVQLMARNDAGSWWAICCVGEAGVPGWASAQFIKPDGSRIEVGNALPVIRDLDELVAILASEADVQADEAATTGATVAQGASELQLEIQQSPPYASQGDTVELRFTVTNTGEQEVANVLLRNQLPGELTYVSATADGDGTVSESNRESGLIVRVKWPKLEVGESGSAIVSVTIASDLPAGAVVDDLAAVNADNAPSVTSAVSIGMAPIALPDF